MRKKHNLTKLVRLWGLVFLTVLALIMVGTGLVYNYHDLHIRMDKMRTDYVEQQKQIIKREVERVVDMINHERAQSEVLKSEAGVQKIILDDAREQIKAGLTGLINSVSYGRNGYLFLLDSYGVLLAHGTQPELIGTNILKWEDSKGNKVVQNLIAASKEEDGAYVSYWWQKPDTGKESPKIAYVKGVSEWEWCVGTGVYLDDIEQDIALLHVALNAQIKEKVFLFIIIIVPAFVLFILLFNLLSSRLRKDFDLFISFFNGLAYSDRYIDRKSVKFTEFDQVAVCANKMLEDKIAAQQDLLDEKEELFVTLHSIGDGVITTDTSGRVMLMNMVAEQLTGWKQEDATGRMLSEVFNIINEDTRETVKHPVDTVLAEGHIVGLANHTVLISKEGTEYNIADSAAPIRDTGSNIRGVVMVFRDVTEQLKREEEIFKAKKLESVGILAGGIAHDFNNLLTGLFGSIELAKTKLSREHEAYPYIETAHEAMERATDLTKQLLTFAKGGDPILEAVEIRKVIYNSARFNLSGSNVKAHFDLPENLWQVEADKGQLSQVIANLIINAKEAMPGGGTIYIKAENTKGPEESNASRLSGDFVRLSIRDEGAGISAKHLDRIFDPYFSTKQTGSGLGLAIVHSIIDKHNGHIRVDSKPGTGTSFTIRLPAGKPLSETESAGSPGVTENRETVSGHILIMDDEEPVRKVSDIILTRCGYTVETAVDGEDAIAKYISAHESGRSFDVVIMDLTIPGGAGGKEAVRDLLVIYPEANVIVSSGYSTDPVMANYSRYGFKGRLVKPYKIEELKTEIRRVMGEEG